MPTITFSEVSVNFPGHVALRNFSATLTEQRIAIIGANGSGKSTAARLINGLESPTAGSVTFDGVNVQRDSRAIRRRVGFIFSDPDNQIIMPSVVEDVELSLRGRITDKAQRRRRALLYLEQMGLSHRATHSPHTLSGGEKQLLALTSVLAAEPETIIADEPTTLLDLRNRLRLGRIFAGLPQQIIAITHDLDFITTFDRALWIDAGTLRADGHPRDVLSAYQQAMRQEV